MLEFYEKQELDLSSYTNNTEWELITQQATKYNK